MYEQLISLHYEYVPVWAFQLGKEFGKSREQIFEDWYNLNVRIPPMYEKEVGQ